MSRRSQITMSEPEIEAFLDEQRTVICATNGRNGWPHLMPLWYVVRDGELWSWTYAKSQKARNLERDPRVTLQVEAGERYEELRGVMIRTRARILRDVEEVAPIGIELAERYGAGITGERFRDSVERQATKRVGLHFTPASIASWDHRKLAGAY